MNITGIHSLIYGCENLEPAKRFLADVGMDSDDGETFGLADGTSIVLRRADDNELPSALVGGDTVREIIWRVDSEDTLKEIGDELSNDRLVTETADGVIHVSDDLGYALGFKVAEPTPLPLRRR